MKKDNYLDTPLRLNEYDALCYCASPNPPNRVGWVGFLSERATSTSPESRLPASFLEGVPRAKKIIALLTAIIFAWTMICPLGFSETINLEGGAVDVNIQDNVTNWNVTGNPIWNVPEFNVNQGSIYNIAGMGSGASLALLVNGGSASNIFGTMNLSNLDFILQNIAGINFGASSMINLNSASLIASTIPLNMNMTDFLKRDYQFSALPGGRQGQGGFLMNDGKITGTNADLVAFVASAMENRGTIDVPMGTVALAAGNTVTIGISPDGLVSIGVDEATANSMGLADQIKNSGTISANGGKVSLTAKAIDGLFDKAINISKNANAVNAIIADNGTIEFQSMGDIYNEALLQAQNGPIKITTERGMVTNAGTIDATKGRVDVKAMDDVFNEALIVASNGEILLDSKAGDILNAASGTLDAGSGSIQMTAGGAIETKGVLKADEVMERGASFKMGGRVEVGTMDMDNLDNRADITAGATLSGIFSDEDDITVLGSFSLIGDTTIWTDSNVTGDDGTLTWADAYLLTGSGYDLTLKVSKDSTVGAITGVNLLTLDKNTGKTPTYTGSTSDDISVATIKTVLGTTFSKDVTVSGNHMIYSASDAPGGLQYMDQNLGYSYKMANSIDASETATWNWVSGTTYSGFAPVGTFTGSLNGNGKTITGLYINRTAPDTNPYYVGLFGYVSGATIQNVGLLNVNIAGSGGVGASRPGDAGPGGTSYVGSLAGWINSGTVSNVYATGSVAAQGGDGGNTTTFGFGGHGGSSYAGGLVGDNLGAVSNSYSLVDVTSNGGWGGLGDDIGWDGGGGDAYGGGLVGTLGGGSITNSFSTGIVSGAGGEIATPGCCGETAGTAYLGGFLGANSAGTLTNNYWLKDAGHNITLSDTGSSDVANITDLTEAKMTVSSNFSGLDFDADGVSAGHNGVWIMAGLPHLQMEWSSSINDVAQLQMMNLDLDANYTLAGDIDALETATWNAGAGFASVGSNASPFAGSLDGGSYAISDLFIGGDAAYLGLFGYAENAEISHIVLSNLTIDSTLEDTVYVGPFIAHDSGSTVTDLTSAGDLTIEGVGDLVVGDITVAEGNTLAVAVTAPSINLFNVTTTGSQVYNGATMLGGTLDVGGGLTISGASFNGGNQAITIRGKNGTYSLNNTVTTLSNMGAVLFAGSSGGAVKSGTSVGHTLGDVTFGNADDTGAWTLSDDLYADTVHVVDGNLTDAGKNVTVYGDILVDNTAGILTSTGLWTQAASGNIGNHDYNNSFGSLSISGNGVTTTLTDNVRIGYTPGSSGYLTFGTGTLNGASKYIAQYVRHDDALTINGLTMGTPLNKFAYYPQSDYAQKGFTLPNGFTSSTFDIEKSNDFSLTAMGHFNLGNNTLQVLSNGSGSLTRYVDMGSYDLTCDNLKIGGSAVGYTSYGGYLNLGSGTHTVTGNVSMGDAANVGNKLDLGSSHLSVGGNIDFTNIAVTKGTSTVTMTAGASGQTITSDGQAFHDLVFDSSNGSGAWTLTGALTAGDLTADSIHVVDGNLTDAGKTVTVYGDITIDSNPDILNSTGTWVQAASGNIKNYGAALDGDDWQSNAFKTLQIASGVTSTQTGNLIARKLILGDNSTVAGDYYLAIAFPTVNDALDMGTNAQLTGTGDVRFYPNSGTADNQRIYQQKAITVERSGSVWVNYAAYATLQMTGNWNVGNLIVHGKSDTVNEVSALVFDTNGHDLTVRGSLALGTNDPVSPGGYQGKIILGSGAHDIARNVYVLSGSNGSHGYFDLGSSNITIGGNVDFTDATVTKGTSTVTLNASASGKTLKSDGEAFHDLVFDSSNGSGAWTLSDDLTADSIHVVDGNLTDAGKTVTVYGDITLDFLPSILTSTGTWVQAANGNVDNPMLWPAYSPWHGNSFSTFKVADGVTSTRTSNLLAKNLVLEQNAKLVGAPRIYMYEPGNDFLDMALGADIQGGTVWVYANPAAVLTQKAFSISAPLGIVQKTSANVQMTGDWTMGGLMVYGGSGSTSEATAGILDTNGKNLTVNGNLVMGFNSPTALNSWYGKILFGSGTHSITGNVSVDAGSNGSHGYLDLGSSNITIGGNVDFTDATVTKGTSTVTMNAGTTGKTLKSDGEAFHDLVFDSSNGSGAWTLEDDLIADSVHVVDGNLTDAGKNVTVYGDMLVDNTAGILTSTGLWTQAASGSISNPAYQNSFGSLSIAGAGVTTTVTDIVTVGYDAAADGYVTFGTGTLNGGSKRFVQYVRHDDALTVNGLRMGTPLLDFLYSPLGSYSQKGFTLPNGFASSGLFVTMRDAYSLKATGEFNLGNNDLCVWDASVGDVSAYVDMVSYGLTSGNLKIGYSSTGEPYFVRGGYLKLGSGTHTVTGNISMGHAENVGNMLDLGTSQLSVGGNIDFTNIAVTPGTSTVILNGAGTQNITSSNQHLYDLETFKDSGTVYLQDAMNVDRNFTLTKGAFDMRNLAGTTSSKLTIGGAYSQEAGTFTARDVDDLTNDITITGSAIAGLSMSGGTFTTNGAEIAVGSGATDTGDFTLSGGTFNAGASTVTVGNDWDSENGTYNYGTSTVNLTGTGNVVTKDWLTVSFYNLSAAYSGKTNTVPDVETVSMVGTLTLNGGTLALHKELVFQGYNFESDIARPIKSTNDNSRITGEIVDFWTPFTTATAKTIYIGADERFSDLVFDVATTVLSSLYQTAPVTFALNRDLSLGNLKIESDSVTTDFTTRSGGHDYNLSLSGDFYSGGFHLSENSQPISVYFNDSTVSIGGNFGPRAQYITSETSVTDSIYLGSSHVSVGGNWSTYNDETPGHACTWVIDPGTSTVTLTGTGKTITSNGNAFNGLTVNGTYALADDLTASSLTFGGSGSVNGSNLYGLTMGGNWTNLISGGKVSNVTGVTLTGSGTITETGSFSDLTVGGTYTMESALTVSNDLTLSAGSLDMRNAAGTTSYKLLVGRDYNQSGGTFTGRDVDDLSADMTVTRDFTLSGGTFNTNGAEMATDDFTLSGGTFNAGASGITVVGDWDSSLGTFNYGTSAVTMTAADGNATMRTPISGEYWHFNLYDLAINSTAGHKVIWSSGTAAAPSHSMSISSEFEVGAGQRAYVGEGVPLDINVGSKISGSGTLSRAIINATQAFTNNGTISVGTFEYLILGGSSSAPVTATSYGGDLRISNKNASSATALLTAGSLSVGGDLIISSYWGSGSRNLITLDNTVNNASITAGNLKIGMDPSQTWQGFSGSSLYNGLFKAGSGAVTIGGDVNIYAGGGNNQLQMGSSTWNVGGNWTIADTVNAGSSTLSVGGDWDSSGGTFNEGTSTVTLDGANQSVSGNNTFYNLSKTVASADMLTFEAGKTQTITGTLMLKGAASQPLSLQSSNSGNAQWNLNPSATQDLDYLSIADMNNKSATPLDPPHSVLVGSNNTNVVTPPPAPVVIPDVVDPTFNDLNNAAPIPNIVTGINPPVEVIIIDEMGPEVPINEGDLTAGGDIPGGTEVPMDEVMPATEEPTPEVPEAPKDEVVPEPETESEVVGSDEAGEKEGVTPAEDSESEVVAAEQDGESEVTVSDKEGEAAAPGKDGKKSAKWNDVPLRDFFPTDGSKKFLTDVRVLEGAVYVIDGANVMNLLGIGESMRLLQKIRPKTAGKRPGAIAKVNTVTAVSSRQSPAQTPPTSEVGKVQPSRSDRSVVSRKSATPIVMQQTKEGMRYGTLKSPGKDVFVKSRGGEWQAAKDDMVILPGDEVKTAERNSVTVVMDGGKVGRVEIQGGSLFRINKAEEDAATGNKTTLLDLALGKILVKVASLKGNSKFEVRSPTALTGVRGTVFEVIVKEKA